MDDDNTITITDDGCSDNTILGGGYSTDTITLNNYTGSYHAAGIGGASGSSSTYTIATGGTSSIYTTGSSNTAVGYGAFLTSTSSGTSWTTAANPATIKVQGDAEFDGEVKIKGKNLSEFMETLEKRLAILQPDPKKLEKFESLKKAYNHYKMLEALCELEDEPDTK